MTKTQCERNGIVCSLLLGLGCLLCGCHRSHLTANNTRHPATDVAIIATGQNWSVPSPRALILAPHAGTNRVDIEITRLQTTLRNETNGFYHLERLGWLFVAKARESFDPGYYKLAEQCALCMESSQPHASEALLLRGHVLQNLHRFKEAEPLARELVARRGRSFDYGLLGDVLMEQGSLPEAAAAYQEMVDEKPDLQAYARIAHLRWLKGDVAGADRIMRLAVGAASPNSPEVAAWVNTRLALLEFQQGNLGQANQACGAALDYERDYPPALLLRGRLLLVEDRAVQAVEILRRAAQLNPLPEYEWLLSEALRAANRDQEAQATEALLHEQAAATDPRTFALYLASRGESPALALELARAELNTRGDVFTHDALAWALLANGQIEDARAEMNRALSEGTRDARLFLHAGVIAARAGFVHEAQSWLDRATPMRGLLLPSEQARLRNLTLEVQAATIKDSNTTAMAKPILSPAN